VINLEELEKAAFPDDHPISYRELRKAVYAAQRRGAAAGGGGTTGADSLVARVMDHAAGCELCRHRMSVIQAADPSLNKQIRAGVAELAVKVVEQEATGSGGERSGISAAGVAGVTAAIAVAAAVGMMLKD
jgi:hypothetical protein